MLVASDTDSSLSNEVMRALRAVGCSSPLTQQIPGVCCPPLAEAFAALKLGIARGLTVHTTPTPELSLPRMSTVRGFVVKTLEAR